MILMVSEQHAAEPARQARSPSGSGRKCTVEFSAEDLRAYHFLVSGTIMNMASRGTS